MEHNHKKSTGSEEKHRPGIQKVTEESTYKKSKKQPIELPKFETVEELMNDSYLHQCISDKVTHFNTERARVSNNGKLKLKSSPIDQLIIMDMFNAKSISKQYLHIHYKVSVLPSAVREFITYLINECVGETFKHYNDIYEEQNNQSLKAQE